MGGCSVVVKKISQEREGRDFLFRKAADAELKQHSRLCKKNEYKAEVY